MSLQAPGSAGDPRDPVAQEIHALGPWFHNLRMPSGHETAADHPLGDFPAFKWRQIAPVIDADLTGLRALDVGCNAGFYSFQLAARGAEVTAVDIDEHYLRQARWAARRLDPQGRVRFLHMPIYDLIGCASGFDLILFLGVLYHLRYPQLALDLLASLTDGQMIVQTLTMPGTAVDVPANLPFEERSTLAQPGWPRAAFIEHAFADDRTNWWVPDAGCVEAMLRSAGLRIVDTPAHETFVCERCSEGDEASGLRDAELRAALQSDAGGRARRGSDADSPPGPQSSQRK